MGKTVTDATDIYFYFEVIKQLAPKSVLDVGMFLKRIGAVARQGVSCEVPGDVLLFGIDLMPEVRLPIYEKVYDGILPKKYFLENGESFQGAGERFDLAVLIEIGEFLDEVEEAQLAEILRYVAFGCVADGALGKRLLQQIPHAKCTTLKVGAKDYVWLQFFD